MELNIDAILVEAGNVATNLTHRCLMLAGQLKVLEDKLQQRDAEIAQLKSKLSPSEEKEVK